MLKDIERELEVLKKNYRVLEGIKKDHDTKIDEINF